MTAFKTQLINDAVVFIDTNEFAESHNLNGTICNAVVEGLTVKQQLIKSKVDFDGLNSRTVIVHCKSIDLSEIPKQGTMFSLDNNQYKVIESIDDFGICTITLGIDEI